MLSVLHTGFVKDTALYKKKHKHVSNSDKKGCKRTDQKKEKRKKGNDTDDFQRKHIYIDGNLQQNGWNYNTLKDIPRV